MLRGTRKSVLGKQDVKGVRAGTQTFFVSATGSVSIVFIKVYKRLIPFDDRNNSHA